MILTELSPLTPDSDSMTLSRMFCEKFQSTPISSRCSSRVHVVDQLRLGARPASEPAQPAGRGITAAIPSRGCSGMKNSTL